MDVPWALMVTPDSAGSTRTCSGSKASILTGLLNRSEEHTSELQSLAYLVCRLLREKKNNELLMQFQSDILNVPVVRPKVAETTSFGAAYAAGLAVGFWNDSDELNKHG